MPEEMFLSAINAAKAAETMYNTYAVFAMTAFCLLTVLLVKALKYARKRNWEVNSVLLTFLTGTLMILSGTLAVHFLRESVYVHRSPVGWVIKRWANSVF